jgi:hypothetical protein
MVNYGAKDALVKLSHTPAGLADTYAYYDISTFRDMFRKTIAFSDRVLKQNRGSTGEGIWVVVPHGWQRGPNLHAVTDDMMLHCTEMKDNHVEVLAFGDFVRKCEQYIVGECRHSDRFWRLCPQGRAVHRG